MPGGDRTGPFGQGPMTGRGAGFCAGQPGPGFEDPGWGWGCGRGGGGRGWGRGGGRGRGDRGGGGRNGGWRHRNWYHATGLTGWQRAGWEQPASAPPPGAPRMSREQELEALRRQAETFQQSLEKLNARIGELESSDEDD